MDVHIDEYLKPRAEVDMACKLKARVARLRCRATSRERNNLAVFYAACYDECDHYSIVSDKTTGILSDTDSYEPHILPHDRCCNIQVRPASDNDVSRLSPYILSHHARGEDCL